MSAAGIKGEGSLEATIRDRLERRFHPDRLVIRDDSERHRGHAGYREGGESHWFVALSSRELADMGRLDRHRAVHAALGPDVMGRLHALELQIGA